MPPAHTLQIQLINLLCRTVSIVSRREIEELVQQLLAQSHRQETINPSPEPTLPDTTAETRDVIRNAKLALFDFLFQKNLSHIQNLAHLLLVRSRTPALEAGELVAELYCEAREAFLDFVWINERAFWSWTSQFMQRKLLRIAETSKRFQANVASEGEQELVDSNSGTPSQQICLQETLEDLRGEVQKLSDREQRVLTLRYAECLSTSETAVLLGISEDNVRQIAKRAREKIALKLSQNSQS